MDKDNSQEPMITSNSPSLEKGREKVYYSSNPAFYVGIDCIIFGFYEGEISLLLLKRNFEPAMGEWSLMGGFVQNNESVDDAAKRVLHEPYRTRKRLHGTGGSFWSYRSRSG